jgi:XRE family transcriptional regulator, thiamine biosynthesis regulator
MHPPDELMTDVALPALRRLVAARLRGEGASQGRISSLLGVTQASVSMYLARGLDSAYKDLEKLSVTREEADRYAAILAEDLKQSPAYAVETLTSIWRALLGRGSVCPAHRALYPVLATCDVCMQGHRAGGGSRDPSAIESVARAVHGLEGMPGFAAVMPEVSVNVAYAPQGSESTEDVVAVPGRIVRVRGSARASLPPEFGASTHLAKVLLVVKSRFPELRAAMNLRYDAKMAKAVSRLGIRAAKVGGEYPAGTDDPVVGAVARVLETSKRVSAIVDEGGRGTEPSLYLFARDPGSLVGLASRVAAAYSAT